LFVSIWTFNFTDVMHVMSLMIVTVSVQFWGWQCGVYSTGRCRQRLRQLLVARLSWPVWWLCRPVRQHGFDGLVGRMCLVAHMCLVGLVGQLCVGLVQTDFVWHGSKTARSRTPLAQQDRQRPVTPKWWQTPTEQTWLNETINQPINQSTNQPINQSTNQPIKQSINLSTNEPNILQQTNKLASIIWCVWHLLCLFC
jgi:hypothetical protein